MEKEVDVRRKQERKRKIMVYGNYLFCGDVTEQRKKVNMKGWLRKERR